MFVAGQRSWATSGASFEAIDPATGERFATVALGDKADIDAAVASARTAFEGGWAGLPPVRRVRILNQLASLLRERRANRKSTRLNSSHVSISYAVFCLKKK